MTRFMFPLIETIRLEDGLFNNLDYHELRMHRALKAICGVDKEIDLKNVLTHFPQSGLFKTRLMYDNKSHEVEFVPYTPRPVNWIKVIYDDTLQYEHKLSDRTDLENHFKKRGTCDDVLIVQKGMITDTSVANVVFRKGREWFTPATCLLPGTMRQSLLDRQMVREIEIGLGDINHFESFRIVNAMLRFDGPEMAIGTIVK